MLNDTSFNKNDFIPSNAGQFLDPIVKYAYNDMFKLQFDTFW